MSAIAIGLPYLAKLETDQLVQKNSELFHFIHGTPYGIFIIILVIILLVEILERIIGHVFEYFTGIEKLLFERYIESETYKKFLLISPGFFLSKRNSRLVSELQSAGSGIPSDIKGFFLHFLVK